MHGLIQAFSRTNRILNSIKKFGNIISFRPLEHELKEAIALFSDKQAEGIILIRSFNDYYEGYQNSNGNFELGYKQLIANLFNKFPLNERICKEQEKKEFITLFGSILKIRNILIVFDEFKGKEIFAERDFQDYLSLYNECYQEFKEKAKATKVNITSDIVFEIELIKQIDINLDYIFAQVQQHHSENIKHKELINKINQLINSSYELRSKKDLIIQFLNKLYDDSKIEISAIDLIDHYNKFKNDQMDIEIEQISKDLNLNLLKTKAYIHDCFKAGKLKTLGTSIDEILPKLPRFSKSNDGNKHYEVKRETIARLQNYFDKFFGA